MALIALNSIAMTTLFFSRRFDVGGTTTRCVQSLCRLSGINTSASTTARKCLKKSDRRCVGLKPRELPGLLGAMN